eukprot:5066831-Pyramimonas_sp.AAC.1
MSKAITTMLRHMNPSKQFNIDQFTDGRVNIWTKRVQQRWKFPCRWNLFEEMVAWKFRDRRDSGNGPSTDAAVTHYGEDGSPVGYENWADYYPIFTSC